MPVCMCVKFCVFTLCLCILLAHRCNGHLTAVRLLWAIRHRDWWCGRLVDVVCCAHCVRCVCEFVREVYVCVPLLWAIRHRGWWCGRLVDVYSQAPQCVNIQYVFSHAITDAHFT